MALSIFPLLLTLFLAASVSEGREFLVGGHENLWKAPGSPDDLTSWGGRMRFLIGDALVWKYNPKLDSVLEVSEEDYDNCKTDNPIRKHTDWNTKIVLNRSGPYYFISGNAASCEKGEKIHVRVLSPKHAGVAVVSPVPAPALAALAPAPAPSEIHVDAPAPEVGGARAVKGGAGMLVMVLLLGAFVFV